MIVGIVGILIGIAVLAAGLYYRKRERGDKESQKIYGIVAVVGGVVAVVSGIVLYINL